MSNRFTAILGIALLFAETSAGQAANGLRDSAQGIAWKYTPPALWSPNFNHAHQASGQQKKLKKRYLVLGLAGLGIAGVGTWMVVDPSPATRNPVERLFEKRERTQPNGVALIGIGGAVAAIGFYKMVR